MKLIRNKKIEADKKQHIKAININKQTTANVPVRPGKKPNENKISQIKKPRMAERIDRPLNTLCTTRPRTSLNVAPTRDWSISPVRLIIRMETVSKTVT